MRWGGWGKVEPSLNPITLRKAKIIYNFGLSEGNRVKRWGGAEVGWDGIGWWEVESTLLHSGLKERISSFMGKFFP